MLKRISKAKKPKNTTRPLKDFNQLAHELVRRSTEEPNEKPVSDAISQIMREMGRKGGLKGGAKRREWSPERRSEAALRAAKARWAKQRRKKED